MAGNGQGLAKDWHLKPVRRKPKLNLRLNVDASFIGLNFIVQLELKLNSKIKVDVFFRQPVFCQTNVMRWHFLAVSHV